MITNPSRARVDRLCTQADQVVLTAAEQIKAGVDVRKYIDAFDQRLRDLLDTFPRNHAEAIAEAGNSSGDAIISHAEIHAGILADLRQAGIGPKTAGVLAEALTNHRRRFLKMRFALSIPDLWTWGDVNTDGVTAEYSMDPETKE